MAKYQKLCNEILKNIGGKENITFATHCVTRLRLNLKDKEAVNQSEIKKIKDVLGCQFSGDQFQIIIGQTVGDVYAEFIQMTGLAAQAAVDENLDIQKEKFSWKKVPGKIMDYVSGCISPILPIIIVTGIFKMLAGLLGSSMLGVLPDDSSFIVLCTFVGDAGFYFYPVFLSWSAAKKLNTSVPLAMFLGGVLIHPTLLNMVAEGTAFNVYGIPVTLVRYSSQFLPSILIVWVLSYVYRFFNEKCPKSLRMVLVPTATMLVMLPLSLCVLGPAGFYIGKGLGAASVWLYNVAGPIAVGLSGALWCFLIATGMHSPVATVPKANIANLGYDNMIFPGTLVAIYCLMGLSLAYLLRCSKDDRAAASASAVSLILGGVGEPTIFGILLRYKQAMIAQLVGGFAGGVIVALLGAKVYFLGATNFLIGIGFGTELVRGMIGCVAGGVITFIIAFILGFKEEKK